MRRIPSQTIRVPYRDLAFESLESRQLLDGTPCMNSTCLVTNTNDSGPGSFRQAIIDANVTTQLDRVRFNISGAAPHRIQPIETLPPITAPVVIDALSDPSAESPVIELNGQLLPRRSTGIEVLANDSVIRGLAINGFGAGIRIASGNGNRLQKNVFLDNITKPIELAGLTANDHGDEDVGPNYFQNHPSLFGALAKDNSSTTISYFVDSLPFSAAYPLTIDFYRANIRALGDLDVTQYLGAVIHPEFTQASQNITLNVAVGVGDGIVATATDTLGNTSEFSPKVNVLSKIPMDSNEPNDALDQPKDVQLPPCPPDPSAEPMRDQIPGNLHTFGDKDYFRFTVSCSSTLFVTLESYDGTDMDLELYEIGKSQPLVASKGGDFGRIAFPVIVNEADVRTFVIGVSGDGEINQDYGLVIEVNTNDQDGDGLLDEWEAMQKVVDEDGNHLDLTGADPKRKDLFVEIDFVEGFGPVRLPEPSVVQSRYPRSPDGRSIPPLRRTGTALDMVIQAFNEAPVTNVGGVPDGIQLHLMIDESINEAGEFPIDGYFGTARERRNEGILRMKRSVFRYALFVGNSVDFGNPGVTEGNNFVIISGQGAETDDELEIVRAARLEKPRRKELPENDELAFFQAGAFMHALGHTLGLKHGGHDDTNSKPNYISVMNPIWAFPRAETEGWTLDYSRFKLPDLDRRNLQETRGIAYRPECPDVKDEIEEKYRDVRVPIGPPLRLAEMRLPIVSVGCTADWNGDGVISNDLLQSRDITRLAVDANGDGFVNDDFLGPDVIEGHDDWQNIRFQFTNTNAITRLKLLNSDGLCTPTAHGVFCRVMEVINLAVESQGDYVENIPPYFDGVWKDWFDIADNHAENDTFNDAFSLDSGRFLQLLNTLQGSEGRKIYDFVTAPPIRLSISRPVDGEPDHDWFSVAAPFSGAVRFRLTAIDPQNALGFGIQIVDAVAGLPLSDLYISDDVDEETEFQIPVQNGQEVRIHIFGMSDDQGVSETGYYEFDVDMILDPSPRPVSQAASNIDLLAARIRRPEINPLRYDLDSSGTFDEGDRSFLIKNVYGSRYGDSTLDGIFDSSDLIHVFQRGEYEDTEQDNSGWADGDWNGDGDFDTSDLVSAFRDGGYTNVAIAITAAEGKRLILDQRSTVINDRRLTWRSPSLVPLKTSMNR
jgi:hypothetical protein